MSVGNSGYSDSSENDDGGKSGASIVHWCNLPGEVDDVMVAGFVKAKGYA